jgi:thioredoxin reductase
VHEDRVERLDGQDDKLQALCFSDGSRLPCEAVFFNTGQYQRSPLLAKLGCELTDRGSAAVHAMTEETCVPGLYVAGDASRDVQLVIVAASEGAKAAFAINKALLAEAGLGYPGFKPAHFTLADQSLGL